jgi:hypothetical protein
MVSTYGSISSLPRASRRDPQIAAYKKLLIAAAASTVASILLLGAVVHKHSSSVLYWHGSQDPGNLNWDGCGAGGNCGGNYHWDSESFSPFSGEAIRMSFTHNHGSFANWFNETEGTWVKGAHLLSPFTGTRNASFWNTSVWIPIANLSEVSSQPNLDLVDRTHEISAAEMQVISIGRS